MLRSPIAHAILLTLVAGLGHLTLGNVNFALLNSLLLGSLSGVIAGALLSNRIADRYLRNAFAVILLAVGGSLLVVA